MCIKQTRIVLIPLLCVMSALTAAYAGADVISLVDSGQNLGDDRTFSIALGDLDGDTDLDAFVVYNNSSDRVYLNDGSGTFTDSGQSLGIADDWGNFVWLGDIDGDNDLVR
jgi:hypothetical protein